MTGKPKLPDLKINGYVVGQFPNVPLVVALIAVVATRLFSRDSTAWLVARALFYVAFISWAYLELTEGANGFRRLLGAAALAWTVYSLQGELS